MRQDGVWSGMAEIRVDPAALRDAGGELEAVAGRVDAARRGLASLGGTAAAAGDGPAAASFERMRAALDAGVDRAGLLLSLLGRRVEAGADGYQATDQAALPPPPAPGGAP
ncbi:MAG TPA: hypothetical protein VF486_28790 [Actinomycetes bacterium]